jgi:hypothetical protein
VVQRKEKSYLGRQKNRNGVIQDDNLTFLVICAGDSILGLFVANFACLGLETAVRLGMNVAPAKETDW